MKMTSIVGKLMSRIDQETEGESVINQNEIFFIQILNV